VKKISAVLVVFSALATSSVHAQSSVTLYGLIDAGLMYANNVVSGTSSGSLFQATRARRPRERCHKVDERIVLSAERDRTELSAADAHIRLAAELSAVLGKPPVLHAEPVLEHEDGLETTAQILCSPQPPSAAVDGTEVASPIRTVF